MGYTPPYLEVRKITGGWQLYPPDYTTTDDLTLSANGTDTYANIKIDGAGGIYLKTQAAVGVQVQTGGLLAMTLNYVAGDNQASITSGVADKDLALLTSGTGVIKFGSYTAGAATDSTGYITIKDAAGNTRKLMVQA